jgi:hypothetical protein
MIRTIALIVCVCLFIGCGHTNKQQSVSGAPEEGHTSERQNAADGDVTYHIFVRDGRKHFAPQIMAAGETSVQFIFPVPESNAVGTLDEHSNGIVFLTFGGFMAEPESRVVAKNFSKEVYGPFDYRFSPNFSDNTIAYCKTRIAVVANVKTGEAFHAHCGLSMDDYLRGIRFLDPQKNLFVLLKSIDENDMSGWKDYLHIAELKGQKFVDTDWSMKIGETEYISSDAPLYQTWFVHNKNLFVYDRGQILCVDGGKSVSHPFSTLFNANSGNIGRVKGIAIHPTLPFGVVIEESAPRYNITVLRWDITDPKKKDEQVVSLAKDLEPLKSILDNNRIVLAYQSFSPDGKWYVVGCVTRDQMNEPNSPHFIAVPVVSGGKERGGFLDMRNLAVLGQVKNMKSIAWTSEPTSYVVSDGELLRKWDLNELPNARVLVMPESDVEK